MSPVTITTVREWAQTIVLVGTVICSCVVVVFKVGGYTTRLESAIADATKAAKQAIEQNDRQQPQIDFLVQAEARRKSEDDARAGAMRRRRQAQPFGGVAIQ